LSTSCPQALAVLAGITDRYEVIVVDDGGRDRTGRSPIAWRPQTRACGSSTIRFNRGYGAALRSGFAAARIAGGVVDGDNQWRSARAGLRPPGDRRSSRPVAPAVIDHDDFVSIRDAGQDRER